LKAEEEEDARKLEEKRLTPLHHIQKIVALRPSLWFSIRRAAEATIVVDTTRAAHCGASDRRADFALPELSA